MNFKIIDYDEEYCAYILDLINFNDILLSKQAKEYIPSYIKLGKKLSNDDNGNMVINNNTLKNEVYDDSNKNSSNEKIIDINQESNDKELEKEYKNLKVPEINMNLSDTYNIQGNFKLNKTDLDLNNKNYINNNLERNNNTTDVTSRLQEIIQNKQKYEKEFEQENLNYHNNSNIQQLPFYNCNNNNNQYLINNSISNTQIQQNYSNKNSENLIYKNVNIVDQLNKKSNLSDINLIDKKITKLNISANEYIPKVRIKQQDNLGK